VAGNLSTKLPWDLAQPKWAATLNPLLANPLVSGRLMKHVSLLAGDNSISHGLGRNLQGYLVVLQGAASTIYDKQATNQMPQLTLVLNASAPVIVSLYVF
jgi:hypothetical protein